MPYGPPQHPSPCGNATASKPLCIDPLLMLQEKKGRGGGAQTPSAYFGRGSTSLYVTLEGLAPLPTSGQRLVGRRLLANYQTHECNAGRKRNPEAFVQSLYTPRKPVGRRDKEWSRLRRMACLVCSPGSVEMLGAEKMTLLTSCVLCVKGRDSWAQGPTKPYHSDENLTPLNSIKVFLVETSSPLHWHASPVIPQSSTKSSHQLSLRKFLT